MAITIEIGIVVIGVFTGTQFSNWNSDRLERIETRRMLTQLQPELRGLISFSTSTSDYYKISRRYAAIALAGWKRDPKVDDRAFVIAAYQASHFVVIPRLKREAIVHLPLSVSLRLSPTCVGTSRPPTSGAPPAELN